MPATHPAESLNRTTPHSEPQLVLLQILGEELRFREIEELKNVLADLLPQYQPGDAYYDWLHDLLLMIEFVCIRNQAERN